MRYSSSWRFLRTRGSRSPYVSHKPPVGRTVSHFLALLLSSSFFLRLLRACLSIIIYLHRCFFLLLLPFSSFFFFSFPLHLSSSSSSHQYKFTFPSSVACPGILVLLDSRSLTFPCFFPHSVFFFFSDSSANIPPPVLSSAFFLLFLLLPLHAGTVFLCAFPAFHSIESRQYVNFRASIWQAVASEVYSNCATKRTWENSAEYCDVLRDCTSLRKRDIAMVYNNEMHRDDHVFSRALQVFSIFIQLIPS